MEQDNNKVETHANSAEGTAVLTLVVSENLHRAFQRCSWVIVNETGRDRLDIMDEMVRDFLVKHGC